ncbi:MAG: molybdopterin-dependent oxidoreductase [Thermomicrobiales bacterium]
MGRRQAWVPTVLRIVASVLAGLAAAVSMLLAMIAGRYWLGVVPPVEAIPDRVAALLSINEFFSLFGKYGGYSGLKRFGILSGLRGVIGVGVGIGLLNGLLHELPFARRGAQWGMVSRRVVLILVTAAALVWIGLVVFLWPGIAANDRGVPYTWARVLTIAALLAWIALFLGVLIGVYRWLASAVPRVALQGRTDASDPVVTATSPRWGALSRRTVVTAGATGLMVWPFWTLLRRMERDATFSYDGTVYSGEDIQPITPTDRFYTVTKNVVDPDVERDLWRLEIGGHVDHGRTYSYDDLMSFDQVDQETTLMCISNRIGAGLFSNAMWKGVRLRDLLLDAGVRDGSVEVYLHGADGYRDTFAFDKAMEETTLLVYQINGEPLPRRHGYPVRVIVPGLYGEKNVKWVTRIDVTTADENGFYEDQGWGPDFVPKTRSDIFSPRTRLAKGVFTFTRDFPVDRKVEVKGRAFAADRGIRSVEFSVDGGTTWSPAEIYYPGTRLTWALWRFEWTPAAPGNVDIVTRAVDGLGNPQPTQASEIVPQGAQGLHVVTATVVA